MRLPDGWMLGSLRVVVEEVFGLPRVFWEIAMSKVFERKDGRVPQDRRVLLDPSTALTPGLPMVFFFVRERNNQRAAFVTADLHPF